MQVMVIVKSNEESEAGKMPNQEMLTKMGAYNEELVKAGIALGMNGLHPSSKGKRVHYTSAGMSVIDGPFAEVKELIGGYWIWKVKSMNQALEWLKKAPFDPGSEIEVRPIYAPEDFGAEFTPELRAQEKRLVDEMKKQSRQ